LHWKFFVGACVLTGALVLPHADTGPVISGMALAAVVHWGWLRIGGRRE
jgi:hypothetical protein